MAEAWLSIGSNIDPATNLPASLHLLKKNFHILDLSSIYETEPMGPAGTVRFWNMAVIPETPLPPGLLREKLREIEAALGRKRQAGDKFAPRSMDIDILPQPGYQEQAFIVVPLAEIIPDGIDPVTGRKFSDLAAACAGSHRMIEKIIHRNTLLGFRSQH